MFSILREKVRKQYLDQGKKKVTKTSFIDSGPQNGWQKDSKGMGSQKDSRRIANG